jgi:hypothetical protein
MEKRKEKKSVSFFVFHYAPNPQHYALFLVAVV